MSLPFVQAADTLLSYCFGISVLDTNLCEEDHVALLMDAGISPAEAVNAVAEKYDLCRIDVDGPYGIPCSNELTEEESEEIIDNWLNLLERYELDTAYSNQFILQSAMT